MERTFLDFSSMNVCYLCLLALKRFTMMDESKANSQVYPKPAVHAIAPRASHNLDDHRSHGNANVGPLAYRRIPISNASPAPGASSTAKDESSIAVSFPPTRTLVNWCSA